MNESRYIGIDVDKRRCRACIMDDEGIILDEFAFPNTFHGIQKLLNRCGGECRAVLESTDNLWLRIYEALEDHGVPVKLANPIRRRR